MLDEVVGAAGGASPEVAVRVALERGRLARSAGRSGEAAPLFQEAAQLAEQAGLEALHVDALHMLALDGSPEEQIGRWMVAWTLRLLGRSEEALAIQRSLKAELEAAGVEDTYVDQELALLE